MTAYDVHEIERHHLRLVRRNNNKELWSQFHIAGFAHNDTYITPYAKCHYTAEYNSLNELISFNLEKSLEEYNRIDEKFADKMMLGLPFKFLFIVLMIVFFILGLVWIIRECGKQ